MNTHLPGIPKSDHPEDSTYEQHVLPVPLISAYNLSWLCQCNSSANSEMHLARSRLRAPLIENVSRLRYMH